VLCWATWFKRLTANGSPDHLVAARTVIHSAETKTLRQISDEVKVLELPHKPAAEQEERSLGKRRALGRSILQLRKPAVANNAGSENPTDERRLFQRERPKSDESE